MKVLLIFPPADHIKEFMSERPPLGLAYIASYLEKEGHEVVILDLNVEDNPRERLYEEIDKCDLIGISVLSVFYINTKELISAIRRRNKKVPIAVGGAHVTALVKETLEENEVDFAVFNEGELTFAELVKELGKKKRNFSKINGMAFKKNGKVVVNPPRGPIMDLDKMPFPARHLLRMDRYVNIFENQRSTVIMTSRGCPYNCFYCSKHNIRSWRPRSPNNVVDEIEDIYKTYGINVILFHDDLFTMDKKRTIAICKEILNRGLKIKWICESRVNTVDEESLRWMKKSGCISIHYGIESGDQGILDKIGKGITLEQVRKAMKLTRKVGIYTKAYMIIGFPWDTEKTINKTIDFAVELKPDEFQFTMLMPYPGTQCWEEAIKEGTIDAKNIDWNVFTPTNLEVKDKVFFARNLPADKIRQLRKKAYRKAVIHMVTGKVLKGDVKYLYHLVKEKKNLGLFKFMKNLFLKR